MLAQEILCHVTWKCHDARGRVGLRLTLEDHIGLAHLSGQAPPTCLLYPILAAVLPPEVVTHAESLHTGRRYPWRVDVRRGMSGAGDYRLRYVADAEWRDTPAGGQLHVSCRDKLNEGLRLWLGDLPPLLAAVVRDYPPPRPQEYTLRVHEPADLSGFAEPGTPSGLQEAIDAATAMHVLAAIGGDAP